MKRAALGSVLLALGVLVAGPAPLAFAHTELVLSTPDDGAVLDAVPDEVELLFSEDLLADSVVVSVEDSAGLVVRVLELEVDGADVVVTWPPGLSGPDYTVNYRVVSQDGHPVSGSLSFTVDGPVPTASSDESSLAVASGPPENDAAAAASDEASSTGVSPGVAAIAAGLGVGIAVGFLFWVMRRRGGTGEPDVPLPGTGP